MSRVCVVTDSTADIPEPLAADLGIVVVPCQVHFGQESFLDGVDLSREQFHARLAAGAQLPTTSPPAVGTFAQVYDQLARRAVHIISIHPASNLSTLYNAARLAAEMTSGASIRLIDSTQASMGTGWLAILAARAALLGQTGDQIVKLLLDAIPRLRLVAAIDDLHFMYRSGRVSWAQALLGSFLHVKPIVMLKSGRVDLLEKVRTRAKAIERLVDITAGLGPLEDVAVLHANALRDAENAVDMLAARLTRTRALVAEAGVTMTTHAGPRAVAFACVLGKS